MTEYVKEKKIININSHDATILRNSSFLSDLTFSFPNILSRNDDVEYIEGSLESAVFPVSFYIINYSNNILNYTIFHLGVYTNYAITIPVGNYDYKTLFTAMTTAFTANGHNFVLTLNEINGIMTMEYKPTSGRVFYRINHNTSTCFRVLGFDVDLDYFPSSDILIAPYALNLLGIKKLKIFCPQFSNSNLDSTNYSTTSLVSTIINDQPPFGQINYYNNSGENGSKLKVFEMNNIDIRITDEFGIPVNFNNCDWSMTFILTTFRIGRHNAIRKIGIVDVVKENIDLEKELEQPKEDEKKDKEKNDKKDEEQPQDENVEKVDENIEDLDFLIRNNPNYFN